MQTLMKINALLELFLLLLSFFFEGGGGGGRAEEIFLQHFMHGFFPDGENFPNGVLTAYILGGCQECDQLKHT